MKLNDRWVVITILVLCCILAFSGCRSSSGTLQGAGLAEGQSDLPIPEQKETPRDPVWSTEGYTKIATISQDFSLVTGDGQILVYKDAKMQDNDLIRGEIIYSTGAPSRMSFDILGEGDVTFRNDAPRTAKSQVLVLAPGCYSGVEGTGIETAMFGKDLYLINGQDMQLQLQFFPERIQNEDEEQHMAILTCTADREIRVEVNPDGVRIYGLTGTYSLRWSSSEDQTPALEGEADREPLSLVWADLLRKS